MAKQILTHLDFNNAARIINLPNGVEVHHPATIGQLNSLAEGIRWKESVEVSTQSNINLSSPGATINGISMSTNDRVLVRFQDTASQNGIYIWNGAATPMTRSLDANTALELQQAVTTVNAGTDAGVTFRQSTIDFVLNTDPVVWTNFGTAAQSATETTAGVAEIATQAETNAGVADNVFVTPLKLENWTQKKLKHVQTFGDSSSTQFTITHNFNTEDVFVEVYRTTGVKDTVIVDVDRTSVNAIRLTFATAPANNEFRVVILG